MLLKNRIVSMKYFMAVTVGFCLDLVLYALLVYFELAFYLAHAIAFIVGACITVLIIRHFVYTKSFFPLGADIALTLLGNGTVFLFGTGLLYVLIAILNFDHMLAKLLTNGITFCCNYVLRLTFFSGV